VIDLTTQLNGTHGVLQTRSRVSSGTHEPLIVTGSERAKGEFNRFNRRH
jgi:hypothetical protein